MSTLENVGWALAIPFDILLEAENNDPINLYTATVIYADQLKRANQVRPNPRYHFIRMTISDRFVGILHHRSMDGIALMKDILATLGRDSTIRHLNWSKFVRVGDHVKLELIQVSIGKDPHQLVSMIRFDIKEINYSQGKEHWDVAKVDNIKVRTVDSPIMTQIESDND